MSQISRLHNFAAGTKIQSSQVDAELDQLVTAHNDQDTNKADKTEVLSKTNTTAYTPTTDYHPATRKYVNDTTAGVILGTVPDNSIEYTKLTPAPASVATVNALAKRDANGRMQAASPSANDDVAIKSYVDGMIVAGTYTGNGAAARTISLPKTPKFVIVRGTTTYNSAAGATMKYETHHTTKGFIFGNPGFAYINAQVNYPRITANGFIVDGSDVNNDLANKNAVVFDYIAFY